ncbi:MAG: tryptophan--tRNA ligase, partial [Thaumarchaeota archaeon]|nr:tryptophan--tRNA ligase [Nitrososphaerota archaeon]
DSEPAKVTPYEVNGRVDYDVLVNQFGVSLITPELLSRIEKDAGELHYLLRRKIFFAHRDLNWLLDQYENGRKFVLYTGRGPSGPVHLGHLIPWMFTKWLQDRFGAELYFQMTDDEKFLFNDRLTLDQTKKYAYENVLDIIALGFDPKKTHIFLDTEYAKTMYNQAIRVAKHITLSTVKASFGFQDSDNIGIAFYTSMQAVPAILASVKEGKSVPCLIPLAIDQDPHFRVARDVYPKLGYPKPALIESKFIPGLGPGGKMSASDPNSAIFVTDTPEQAAKKVMNAFTGQQATAELQRRYGGNPDICSVCQYYVFLFEQDDAKLQVILDRERSGDILAGEHKADLAERVKSFLADHQKIREKAKDHVEEFMLRD